MPPWCRYCEIRIDIAKFGHIKQIKDKVSKTHEEVDNKGGYEHSDRLNEVAQNVNERSSNVDVHLRRVTS